MLSMRKKSKPLRSSVAATAPARNVAADAPNTREKAVEREGEEEGEGEQEEEEEQEIEGEEGVEGEGEEGEGEEGEGEEGGEEEEGEAEEEEATEEVTAKDDVGGGQDETEAEVRGGSWQNGKAVLLRYGYHTCSALNRHLKNK